MANITGLTGLRPALDHIGTVTTPPYDIIKEGSPLEGRLQSNPHSFYHVILGTDPVAALNNLISEKILQEDNTPCFYVYEQNWEGGGRTGLLAGVQVYDYASGEIIRHESIFDDKVKGRVKLTLETGYTMGPIFFLTKSKIKSILHTVVDTFTPEYDFTTDLHGLTDLHGIHNRIFRVEEQSPEGKALQEAVSANPLYIADGHHRYHSAIKTGQTHTMAYITEDFDIKAYNRVAKGSRTFEEIKNDLELEPCPVFSTPPKHAFLIYSGGKTWHMKARKVPGDVVGCLDCSILERELLERLEIPVMDQEHLDYYPESDLEAMKSAVDSGKYNLAVALHPVSPEELMRVADANLANPEIVMPEKSTFFSPKILSGVFLYRHTIG